MPHTDGIPPLDPLRPAVHNRRVMEPVPDEPALSFEVALARLEKIVHRLEAGEATLEESIDLYTEGQRLKAHCEDKLAGATARIEAIVVGGDGRAVGVTPFDAG